MVNSEFGMVNSQSDSLAIAENPPAMSLQTEFEFLLPKGYLDAENQLHRNGLMRLSRAVDEIVPMGDPRVQANPAYSTVLILSRVVTRLGEIDSITPTVVEGLFAEDLQYLQTFYRKVNGLVN